MRSEINEIKCNQTEEYEAAAARLLWKLSAQVYSEGITSVGTFDTLVRVGLSPSIVRPTASVSCVRPWVKLLGALKFASQISLRSSISINSSSVRHLSSQSMPTTRLLLSLGDPDSNARCVDVLLPKMIHWVFDSTLEHGNYQTSHFRA